MVNAPFIIARDIGTGQLEIRYLHVPDSPAAARDRVEKALKEYQESQSVTGLYEANIASVDPELLDEHIVIYYSQYTDTLGEENDDLAKTWGIIERAARDEPLDSGPS